MGKVFEIKKDLKGLAEFRKSRPQKARAIMGKGARFIELRQKQLCPRGPDRYQDGEHLPHLRDTIHIENRGTFEVVVVEGNDVNDYGLHVEFGTERMAAQPHVRPAAAEGVRYIDAELRKLARE